MKSATFFAATKSGAEASNPIENECNSCPLPSNNLDVIDAINDESNPPESNTPKGTSHINRFSTACVKLDCKACKSNFSTAVSCASHSGL